MKRMKSVSYSLYLKKAWIFRYDILSSTQKRLGHEQGMHVLRASSMGIPSENS